MAGLNKVMLIGNLGRDPEIRSTPSGTQVANFTLATTENFTDRSGNRTSRTEWHRIVAWGRLAEICGQYLRKGKQVYIEGRIQTRQWEDQQGQRRTTTEIVATNMIMLGRANGEPVQDTQYEPSEADTVTTTRESPQAGGDLTYEPDSSLDALGNDDDLPF